MGRIPSESATSSCIVYLTREINLHTWQMNERHMGKFTDDGIGTSVNLEDSGERVSGGAGERGHVTPRGSSGKKELFLRFYTDSRSGWPRFHGMSTLDGSSVRTCHESSTIPRVFDDRNTLHRSESCATWVSTHGKIDRCPNDRFASYACRSCSICPRTSFSPSSSDFFPGKDIAYVNAMTPCAVRDAEGSSAASNDINP